VGRRVPRRVLADDRVVHCASPLPDRVAVTLDERGRKVRPWPCPQPVDRYPDSARLTCAGTSGDQQSRRRRHRHRPPCPGRRSPVIQPGWATSGAGLPADERSDRVVPASTAGAASPEPSGVGPRGMTPISSRYSSRVRSTRYARVRAWARGTGVDRIDRAGVAGARDRAGADSPALR
jgi:hypothetical protein